MAAKTSASGPTSSSAIGIPASPPAARLALSGTDPTSGTPISLGKALPAAGPEDLVGLTVLAGEGRHVLDDAGDADMPPDAPCRLLGPRPSELLG